MEGSGKNILVVEDHLDTQLLMKQTLKRDGCTVSTASNGTHAFAYLENNPPPDVILLDLTLPEMTGDEFMQKLRENPKTRNQKVLIISGWDNLKERAETIGANGFLRKPFQIAQFHNQLDQIFAASSPSQHPPA